MPSVKRTRTQVEPTAIKAHFGGKDFKLCHYNRLSLDVLTQIDCSDLIAFSLINKLSQRAASPVLYGRVALTTKSEKIESFLRSIKKNSELAHHVQQLDLHLAEVFIPDSNPKKKAKFAANILNELTKTAKSVTSLKLVLGQNSSARLNLNQFAKNVSTTFGSICHVTQFSLTGSIWFHDLVKLFQIWPNLTHLYLHELRGDVHSPLRAAGSPFNTRPWPQIISLVIDSHTLVATQFEFLLTNQNKLRKLHLSVPGTQDSQAIRAFKHLVAENLVDLKLWNSWSNPELKRVKKSNSTREKGTNQDGKIESTASNDEGKDLSQSILQTILFASKSRLQSLHLSTSLVTPKSLKSLFANIEFPELVHLSFDDTLADHLRAQLELTLKRVRLPELKKISSCQVGGKFHSKQNSSGKSFAKICENLKIEWE